MKEFNEWAQCIILELVSKYVPMDTEEIFDIMNLLEDRLHHANGAVVLATIKVFLHMTLSMTDVHQQVLYLFILLSITSQIMMNISMIVVPSKTEFNALRICRTKSFVLVHVYGN